MLVWRPWGGGLEAPPSAPSGAPTVEQAAGGAGRARASWSRVAPAPGFASNLTGAGRRSTGLRIPGALYAPTPRRWRTPSSRWTRSIRKQSGYQAIGEPLNVEDEDLTLEEPLWIGEPLDADDPEAGVSEDLESEVTAVGAPLDADGPPEEAIPAAPPRHIGEPLDADAPDDP